MHIAITREVSPDMAACELSFVARSQVVTALAQSQHAAYQDALRGLGCEVISLAAEPSLPDAVFVEDTALVFDEVAVITRPGAVSRRAETGAVAEALRVYRPLLHIDEPATLDGGDVLRIGPCVYVGISARSNAEAVAQLRRSLAPHGYSVQAVAMRDCLHLKSAVTQVAADTVLINTAWVDAAVFAGYRQIEVDPNEPHAANALLIGDALIYPTNFPRTRERLENAGIRVVAVDVGELQKAEGAVTCCSLLFAAN
jgi:dimethylargininase